MRYRCSVALGFALLLSLAPMHAAFAWGFNGNPLLTNPGDQAPAAVRTDGAYGAYVVSADAAASSVVVQHLDLNGGTVSGWSVAGLVLSGASGARAFAVAEDATRGVFVLGKGAAGSSPVRLWRVGFAGDFTLAWPAAGLALPLPAGDLAQTAVAVTPDGVGGAFLVTEANSQHLFHVTSAGVLDPAWPASGTNLGTVAGPDYDRMLVADATGGVYVAFALTTFAHQSTAYVRHFKSNGVSDPAWPARGRPVSTVPGENVGFSMCSDGAGGVLISIVNSVDGIEPGVATVQRVTPSGALAAGWPATGLSVSSAIASVDAITQIVANGTGGGMVKWVVAPPAANTEPRLARFSPTGTLVPGWPLDGIAPVPMTYGSPQSDLLDDGSGGAYLAVTQWTDASETDTQVRLQHVDASGSTGFWPAGGRPIVPLDPPASTLLLAPSLGGLIAGWGDLRDAATNGEDVYATRLDLNGAVAVSAALLSSDVTSDRVSLAWQVSGAPGAIATLYRREEASGWQALGDFIADGEGRIAAEDASVAAGARYAYRLGWADGGAERFGPEAWINVPASTLFALGGFSPNPSPARAQVSFALGSASPATLEVLDVAGRSVVRQEVGAMGAGRHVLTLGAPLPPGLYLLRLAQDGRVLVARGAVVR